MTARDDLRKYVSLLGDWWTPRSETDERVERLYQTVRAEVLAEAADVADGIGARLQSWEGADGAYVVVTELRRMAATPGPTL